jgi:hypothetical protein
MRPRRCISDYADVVPGAGFSFDCSAGSNRTPRSNNLFHASAHNWPLEPYGADVIMAQKFDFRRDSRRLETVPLPISIPTFRLRYLRIKPTIEAPEQVRKKDDQSYR